MSLRIALTTIPFSRSTGGEKINYGIDITPLATALGFTVDTYDSDKTFYCYVSTSESYTYKGDGKTVMRIPGLPSNLGIFLGTGNGRNTATYDSGTNAFLVDTSKDGSGGVVNMVYLYLSGGGSDNNFNYVKILINDVTKEFIFSCSSSDTSTADNCFGLNYFKLSNGNYALVSNNRTTANRALLESSKLNCSIYAKGGNLLQHTPISVVTRSYYDPSAGELGYAEVNTSTAQNRMKLEDVLVYTNPQGDFLKANNLRVNLYAYGGYNINVRKLIDLAEMKTYGVFSFLGGRKTLVLIDDDTPFVDPQTLTF